MNNKGFAITTILYGILVLFCILLVSMLGILSSYKKTQDILVDSINGTRDILKYETKTQEELGDSYDVEAKVPGRINYCMTSDTNPSDDTIYCCSRSVTFPGGHNSIIQVNNCSTYLK